MPIKFVANSNILVVGCSGSGKTTNVLRIISERLIDPMPSKIRALASARGSVATRGPEGPEGGNTAARGPESVETEAPKGPRTFKRK